MYTEIKHRVAEILERHGLSGRAFDRAIGVSPGYSAKWLTLQSEPTISYAYRIAVAFGYRCEDLAAAEPLPQPSLDPDPIERSVMLRDVGLTRFGESVRYLVELRGQSGRAFARELDVSPSTARGWLDETSEPRLWAASKCARVLGVSLHDLVTGVLLPEQVDQDTAHDRDHDHGNEQPACGPA